MRNFMRVGRENALLLASAGDFGVDEQYALKGKDRAPVLHRAKELALAWASHVIEFR